VTAPRPRASWLAPVTVVLLALLALGPVLLHRGYVLAGDMTFVPDQPWKPAWLGLDGSVPRAVPADAVVSVLGRVVPGDLLQKAILLAVLVGAGLGVLRLAARIPGLAASARMGGAVLYVWNPYVFERLAIGHWGLLVGYAALPWVVAAGLEVRRGGVAAHARLFLWVLLAAVGSPTGGLVAGLVAVVVAADRRRLLSGAVVLASALVANLPWLAPGVLNEAPPGDGSGVAAFAARADTPLGAWGSLLSLGGIWKEAAAPAERGTGLLVVVALLVAVAALVGLGTSARTGGRAEPVAPRRLLLLGAVGFLLAAVPATGPGERFVARLVEAVPAAGILRDSQKWLQPLALVLALGFALLLDHAARRLRRVDLPASGVAVLALLPVVLLPSLAWGLSGRFEPVRYPTEWSTVRRVIEEQPAAERRTAVLPWSAYQRLPWNGGRAALDPALRFFPGQVVVDEDLSVSASVIVRGGDRAEASIGRAIRDQQPLAPALAAAGVRFLLVERTAAGAAGLPVPTGTTLHAGPELLLVDLGSRARQTRAPHTAAIVSADVLTLAAAVVAAGLSIRRKAGGGSATMQAGAVSTTT
jgi:hypothetical protein